MENTSAAEPVVAQNNPTELTYAEKIANLISSMDAHLYVIPADGSVTPAMLRRETQVDEKLIKIVKELSKENVWIKLLALNKKEIEGLQDSYRKLTVSSGYSFYDFIISHFSGAEEFMGITQIFSQIPGIGAIDTKIFHIMYADIINRLIEIEIEPQYFLFDVMTLAHTSTSTIHDIVRGFCDAVGKSPAYKKQITEYIDSTSENLAKRIYKKILEENQSIAPLIDANDDNLFTILRYAVQFGDRVAVAAVTSRVIENVSMLENGNNRVLFIEWAIQAIIRGDTNIGLSFIQPGIWAIYSEIEKLAIIKFIALRSGDTARPVLLESLTSNSFIDKDIYSKVITDAELSEDQIERISGYFGQYHEDVFDNLVDTFIRLVKNKLEHEFILPETVDSLNNLSKGCQYIDKKTKQEIVKNKADLLKSSGTSLERNEIIETMRYLGMSSILERDIKFIDKYSKAVSITKKAEGADDGWLLENLNIKPAKPKPQKAKPKKVSTSKKKALPASESSIASSPDPEDAPDLVVTDGFTPSPGPDGNSAIISAAVIDEVRSNQKIPKAAVEEASNNVVKLSKEENEYIKQVVQSIDSHLYVLPSDGSVTAAILPREAQVDKEQIKKIKELAKDNALIKFLALDQTSREALKNGYQNSISLYHHIISRLSDSQVRSEEVLGIAEMLVQISEVEVYDNKAFFIIYAEIINGLIEIGVEPQFLLFDVTVLAHISTSKIQNLARDFQGFVESSQENKQAAEAYINKIQPDLDKNIYQKILIEKTSIVSLIDSDDAKLFTILRYALQFSDKEAVEAVMDKIIENTNILKKAGYYKLFIGSAVQAIIRGDANIGLPFIRPEIWNIYRDEDKLNIIKLIILRSGDTARPILIDSLISNSFFNEVAYYSVIIDPSLSDAQIERISDSFKQYHEATFAALVTTFVSMLESISEGKGADIATIALLEGLTRGSQYISIRTKKEVIAMHAGLLNLNKSFQGRTLPVDPEILGFSAKLKEEVELIEKYCPRADSTTKTAAKTAATADEDWGIKYVKPNKPQPKAKSKKNGFLISAASADSSDSKDSLDVTSPGPDSGPDGDSPGIISAAITEEVITAAVPQVSATISAAVVLTKELVAKDVKPKDKKRDRRIKTPRQKDLLASKDSLDGDSKVTAEVRSNQETYETIVAGSGLEVLEPTISTQTGELILPANEAGVLQEWQNQNYIKVDSSLVGQLEAMLKGDVVLPNKMETAEPVGVSFGNFDQNSSPEGNQKVTATVAEKAAEAAVTHVGNPLRITTKKKSVSSAKPSEELNLGREYREDFSHNQREYSGYWIIHKETNKLVYCLLVTSSDGSIAQYYLDKDTAARLYPSREELKRYRDHEHLAYFSREVDGKTYLYGKDGWSEFLLCYDIEAMNQASNVGNDAAGSNIGGNNLSNEEIDIFAQKNLEQTEITQNQEPEEEQVDSLNPILRSIYQWLDSLSDELRAEKLAADWVNNLLAEEAIKQKLFDLTMVEDLALNNYSYSFSNRDVAPSSQLAEVHNYDDALELNTSYVKPKIYNILPQGASLPTITAQSLSGLGEDMLMGAGQPLINY